MFDNPLSPYGNNIEGTRDTLAGIERQRRAIERAIVSAGDPAPGPASRRPRRSGSASRRSAPR